MPIPQLPDDVRQQVAEDLDFLVKEKGVQIGVLAAEAELSTSTLYSYMRLTTSPRQEFADWIAERRRNIDNIETQMQQPVPTRKKQFHTTIDAIRANRVEVETLIESIKQTQTMANPLVKAGLGDVIAKLECVHGMLDI